jgi:hypothetical protein
LSDDFLPSVPADLVRAAYIDAPGNELGSGKLASPESSAALVANAFGWFLGPRQALLPPLPGVEDPIWTVGAVRLEAVFRFPWAGGRHPCLDASVLSDASLIGVESKRFEPFRAKREAELSDAYWRPVWGKEMQGYERIRDALCADPGLFLHLDAAQLVKHAFGLRTEVNRAGSSAFGKRAHLFYLYAEPDAWPDGRPVPCDAAALHRAEVARFATAVAGDEVAFHACRWRDLLLLWAGAGDAVLASHATAVRARFRP